MSYTQNEKGTGLDILTAAGTQAADLFLFADITDSGKLKAILRSELAIALGVDTVASSLSSHVGNTSNPHSVTKSQVGLGNVVNLDTSTTANIADSSNKRFVTDADLIKLSGTIGDMLAANNLSEVNASAAKTNLGVDTDIAAALASANSYADGLVVGLLDDRGNYDASGNVFPSTGGSGTAGAVLKGDIWTISVSGTLGGAAVTPGDVVRALTDSPGQTAANWVITENNFGYVAENSTNKSTDVNADQGSNTKYPSVKSVYDWAVALFLGKSGGNMTGAINETKGSNIASASSIDLGAATGNMVDVTGTTTITALGTVQAGTRRTVRFTGILTLTHNATSLILPTGANITTQAGDTAIFISLGSGNWVCAFYMRKDGTALSAAGGGGDMLAANNLSEVNASAAKTNLGVDTDIAAALASANSYADGLVVGLLDDRGNYDASGNVFPSSGGSGTAGAVLKGDIWTISVSGTLGGAAVTPGDVVRALIDTPGQTAANWAITENNIGYVAENSANKSTDVNADQASNTKFPSVKAVYDWAVALLATKRPLDRRINSQTSASSITPDSSLYDGYHLTALAAALTVNAPTGSPVDGRMLMIRITDNGTARALTFDGIFRASPDLALPITTVISKTMYLGFAYNSTATKWDLVSKLNNL